MKFRWIALIALYTLLIGPVFDNPGLASVMRPVRAASQSMTPAFVGNHP
jgi:hypothetical protein